MACLIIKMFMIGNRNHMLRFPNGFHNTSLQSIGRNEYGKTGHSRIFYCFEALLDRFEAQFMKGFNITPSQTLITRRAVHLRFYIVKRCLYFIFPA